MNEWKGEERRSSSREDLVKAVVCAIRDEVLTGGLDETEHREQHIFIREWIEEVRIKRDRREKIKTQVLGWGLVTFLGSLGTAAYQGFLYLRDHLK